MSAPAEQRPALQPQNIPAELRSRPQWVVWRAEMRDGKPTKVPYCPTGKRAMASSDDPETWGTFDAAWLRFTNQPDWAGIGYVFAADDPYAGVDLDGCRCPATGKLEPWASRIVDLFRSYAEVSPSGSGVKMWIAASKPAGAKCKKQMPFPAPAGVNKDVEVEVYDQLRYFAVTGWRLDGAPEEVYDRQAELEQLCAKLWPAKTQPEQPKAAPAQSIEPDDEKLISAALSANAPWIAELWKGDTSMFAGDHSRARMALLTALAHWTGCDGARIRRLYERSGLYPQRTEKWERLAAEEIRRAVAFARLGDKASTTKPSAEKNKPSPAELGAGFLQVHRVIAAHARLYVYRDGFYQPDGEAVARAWVQARLGDKAREHDGNEVCYWLETDRRVDPALLDQGELINVRNGLLDWRTGDLKPHSPDVLSTVQLPVEWRADAHHDRGDAFLDEVLSDRATRGVIEELAGYCLLPGCGFQKAAMFTGRGSNGKSVLLDWLAEMLGLNNCSTLRLQDLSDRFRTAELLGKLANIHADLPRQALDDSGIFKMLVTGDALTAERKFKDPFTFRSRAKLIFSANELPGTSDRSPAFFRRWLVIHFPNQFVGKQADEGLAGKLCSDEGRSYLLRLAVEGLRRLVARGYFAETDAMKDAVASYQRQADSVVEFFEEHYAYVGGQAFELKDDVYRTYGQWCADNGHRALPSNIFAQRLLSIEPRITSGQRSIGTGNRLRCWIGLATSTAAARVRPSEPVQGTPWSDD